MTLPPRREIDSAQGSLLRRELPTGVRDSVGSAAGESALLVAGSQKLEAPARSHPLTYPSPGPHTFPVQLPSSTGNKSYEHSHVERKCNLFTGDSNISRNKLIPKRYILPFQQMV